MPDSISLRAALAFLCFAPFTTNAAFLTATDRPADEVTANLLYKPTLNYNTPYQYSAWDMFYAPRGGVNYPDLYAPYGGEPGDQPGTKRPVARPIEFPKEPDYNVDRPMAFWDTRNAKLVQTEPAAFITSTNNIYSFSGKTKFYIENSPNYAPTPSGRLGTVFMQFETFGSLPDFSSIHLVYHDGEKEVRIGASDTEYLREYTTGTGSWSGPGSYISRVAVQWDMSQLNDLNGAPISSYKIHFDSSTSSMSLMAVDLITSGNYQAGLPLSATWSGGAGSWDDSAKWNIYRNGAGDANAGITLPQQNGNIRFDAAVASSVELTSDFTLGELIFESAPDVSITSATGSEKLISNTGVTTRGEATGVYQVNADWEFGAINFFEIESGTVEMNGVLSGAAGMLKRGDGTLVLGNDNTFGGYLVLDGGTLRMKGANAYSGSTTLISGKLILEQGSAGLGTSTGIISFGADGPTYEHINPGATELWLDGGGTFSRHLELARGDIEKRIGAVNSPDGATFSGQIDFSAGNSAAPHAGNIFFTAEGSDDRLVFSGVMARGDRSKTLTIDGQGTVEFSGVDKGYHHSTTVASGTLLIASGTAVTGNGNWRVNEGARLALNGTLAAGNGGSFVLEGTLSGNGTLQRAITLASGAVLAPGNSVGTLHTVSQTWGAGGVFELEFADFNGSAGTGWDLLEITGNLAITATEADRFIIDLVSLDLLGEAGDALAFQPTKQNQWLFATFTGTLSGFDPAAFEVTTHRFSNLHAGAWGVEAIGSALYLTYQPIPEPSVALLGVAGAALLWRTRRRGNKI